MPNNPYTEFSWQGEPIRRIPDAVVEALRSETVARLTKYEAEDVIRKEAVPDYDPTQNMAYREYMKNTILIFTMELDRRKLEGSVGLSDTLEQKPLTSGTPIT